MKTKKQITLILGDQLFSDWTRKSDLALNPGDEVLMIEHPDLASRYRYHKLRIIHAIVAMREFRDHLERSGIRVQYLALEQKPKRSIFEHLKDSLAGGTGLRVAEISDRRFRAEIEKFCQDHQTPLTVLPTPHFLCSREVFKKYLSTTKRPFMKTFYERERKRLGILVEKDGSPTGGQWSFDVENRKKLPKTYEEPNLPPIKGSAHEEAVRGMVEKHFPDHPGSDTKLKLPVSHEGAREWLECFLKERFWDFGPYEDSISTRFETLNHSLLSPLINLGLLTPGEVVERTLAHAKKAKVPMASLEGFIRQIIGWREFIRGIDENFGERQEKSNFFQHERRLTSAWYEGSTGIPPLDDVIRRVQKNAYLHHIERLMIVSNLMLLSEIQPADAHRWFMEMFLDSYEWVMGPNVYGMGLMSDGGIFATKPYISGSNYILKMGDYTKGPWCDTWDGLYWSFIEKHRKYFLGNPRLSMMVKLLDRMPDARKKALFAKASEFKSKFTA